MNGFDAFQMTKPRLLIGQAVRAIGSLAGADLQLEMSVVTGMVWDPARRIWNISTMTLSELRDGGEVIDGWAEEDLANFWQDAEHTEGTPNDHG